jgi:hypothetical protein
MEVEFALGVAQEDHEGGIQVGLWTGNGPGGCPSRRDLLSYAPDPPISPP